MMAKVRDSDDAHVPVMPVEVLAALDVRVGGVYVDGTLGAGGHARAILERAGPSGTLLGIDRDPAALALARERLRDAPGTALIVAGNHGDLAALARAHGVTAADGVLLDLGVSSLQLDIADRGFSFMRDGPLDMRMDPTCGETAAGMLARLDVGKLTALLRTLGEEPRAAAIARALVRARDCAPLQTTAQLADLVTRAGGWHGGRRHPATRVFQALRLAVNDELGALARALEDALALLKPGGRLVTIAFESLSDRTVKTGCGAHVWRQVSLPQGGSRWEGQRPAVAWVHRHPLRPSAAEVAANPRSRSAKLRAVRRLEPAEEARLVDAPGTGER